MPMSLDSPNFNFQILILKNERLPALISVSGDIAGWIFKNQYEILTFDWRVLWTEGQRRWATFLMLFPGIPHLAMVFACSQIAK